MSNKRFEVGYTRTTDRTPLVRYSHTEKATDVSGAVLEFYECFDRGDYRLVSVKEADGADDSTCPRQAAAEVEEVRALRACWEAYDKLGRENAGYVKDQLVGVFNKLNIRVDVRSMEAPQRVSAIREGFEAAVEKLNARITATAPAVSATPDWSAVPTVPGWYYHYSAHVGHGFECVLLGQRPDGQLEVLTEWQSKRGWIAGRMGGWWRQIPVPPRPVAPGEEGEATT